MAFLKRINRYRRSVMRRLTKNIGRSQLDDPIVRPGMEIKRILICRPNHRLGNMLFITPLVQEILLVFPECRIDLFVKGSLAPAVFRNYENIDRIIQLPEKYFKKLIPYLGAWIAIRKRHYDIVINADSGSSSGRISTRLARTEYKFFGDIPEEVKRQYSDYRHMARFPVYNFRYYLANMGRAVNTSPVPMMDLRLSPAEREKGKILLLQATGSHNKTISIFTYATGNKCYGPSWWEPVYKRLQTEFSDYTILEILPLENVSQIGFKAPVFSSRDIREVASVIANTALFIGADSGVMHLASASQTPTVGLFNVTDEAKYGPYGNNSIALNTDHVNDTRYDHIPDPVISRAVRAILTA